MGNGPIEFLSDKAVERLGDSEYGGGAGLVEKAVDPLGGRGHKMTPSERSGALRRGANAHASDVYVASLLTGTVADRTAAVAAAVNADVVDPVSGRVDGAEPDGAWSEDVTGTGGTFSDLQPG